LSKYQIIKVPFLSIGKPEVYSSSSTFPIPSLAHQIVSETSRIIITHTYLLAHLWSNDCINSRCLNILHQFVPVPTRGTHHKWQSSTTIELRIPFKRIDQKGKKYQNLLSRYQISKQASRLVTQL
jgi:hypothetical protein